MVTDFKENLNLQLPLLFYISISFVSETVSVSEQIAENRFGSLLETSDKYIKQVKCFDLYDFAVQMYCMTLKTHWVDSFA